MRIAVFGGRFDPPHLGHLWVARQIKDYVPDVSHVLLVPANQHQWKPTEASSKDRLAMIEMLCEEGIVPSNIELRRGGISYSIDTIKAVKKETGSEMYWIIGSDILTEFDRWEKKDELLKEATFLVFPRDPYHLPTNIPSGFKVLDNPDLLTSNLSSTIIRRRIKKNLSIHEFVPPKVEEYIFKHNLYETYER